AFSKIWIVSIILTFLIILIGGISIYFLVSKVIKAKVRCLPPYGTACETSLDCISQTKCQAGQGIICLPQCKYEGYDFYCSRHGCSWFQNDIGPIP
ncbi:MAG: hypothetical protein QME61_04380, partial [Patescibacteria group bacterium]|nr:hypothetical protein [Patescibacteria group bacterium]